MSGQNSETNAKVENHAFNRRKMLLGGTTLAAAAFAPCNSIRIAQAQQQPAAPASGKNKTSLSSSATTSANPISVPIRSA